MEGKRERREKREKLRKGREGGRNGEKESVRKRCVVYMHD